VNRSINYKSAISFVGLILLLITIFLPSCETRRKRPYGFVSLGKIEELRRPNSFFSDKGLLLRHDQNGFSVMSLLCTHDLSPLELKQNAESSILASKLTSSTYALDGKVLSGPSNQDLPYFELVVAQSAPGKPVDSLFARIGYEKSKEWRLNPPTSPGR
jgi:hypothetical protein